jgi:hypothetical protein
MDAKCFYRLQGVIFQKIQLLIVIDWEKLKSYPGLTAKTSDYLESETPRYGFMVAFALSLVCHVRPKREQQLHGGESFLRTAFISVSTTTVYGSTLYVNYQLRVIASFPEVAIGLAPISYRGALLITLLHDFM